MTTLIQPLGERVLVEPPAPEVQTPSGIILPPKTDARPCKGTVIACGPQVQSVHIRPGAFVLFHRHAGAEFHLDGRTFYVLDMKDVLATVTETDDAIVQIPRAN